MKETELQNTSETSKAEVQNLSAQDKARKHRKTAKAEGIILGRPKGKKSAPDKYKLHNENRQSG